MKVKPAKMSVCVFQVQKVLDAAQVNKERSVLRLHRQVWFQEHHRLNIAR